MTKRSELATELQAEQTAQLMATSPNAPHRVLILSADAGFGHKAAANAIAAAFDEKYADRTSVRIVNPLDHTNAPGLLVTAQDDYDRMIQQSPDLYRVGYQASDGAIPAGLAEQALTLMLFTVLRDILGTHRPDVVITTYPLYQAPLATLNAVSRRVAPFLTVVTDLASVHRLWFNESAEMCLVPTEAVALKAIESGLSRDRVEVTGLPVNPRLAQPVDKASLRAKLGWRDDRVVALFTGSKRVKKLEPVAQALNHSGLPLELAIVTGGDEGLRHRFEAEEWHLPAHVYGYVDSMWELMQAADFIVCKAGGLIVSEALAAGLPLLIAEALPGQETGNVEHVVRGGAGMLVNDALEALVQVYHWLDKDGAALKAVAARARALGRPDAAVRVADRALEVAIRGPRPLGRGLSSQIPRLRELLGLDAG
jgi:1,2-diacylglycerol 3-beta-galactosyltransferase